MLAPFNSTFAKRNLKEAFSESGLLYLGEVSKGLVSL